MLPNQIRKYRLKAGLSQQSLGDKIGRNKAKISKLETGEQELTQHYMELIAKAITEEGVRCRPHDLLPPAPGYEYEEQILDALDGFADKTKKSAVDFLINYGGSKKDE